MFVYHMLAILSQPLLVYAIRAICAISALFSPLFAYSHYFDYHCAIFTIWTI